MVRISKSPFPPGCLLLLLLLLFGFPSVFFKEVLLLLFDADLGSQA